MPSALAQEDSVPFTLKVNSLLNARHWHESHEYFVQGARHYLWTLFNTRHSRFPRTSSSCNTMRPFTSGTTTTTPRGPRLGACLTRSALHLCPPSALRAAPPRHHSPRPPLAALALCSPLPTRALAEGATTIESLRCLRMPGRLPALSPRPA